MRVRCLHGSCLSEPDISPANLKMMMNLLRDKSRNIQFEAFHVFKVFVANPKKPPQIETILRRNKEKLLAFLKGFHNDKEGTSGNFVCLRLGNNDLNFADEQFSVCILTPITSMPTNPTMSFSG
jgi:Mo25-like